MEIKVTKFNIVKINELKPGNTFVCPTSLEGRALETVRDIFMVIQESHEEGNPDLVQAVNLWTGVWGHYSNMDRVVPVKCSASCHIQ